MTDKVIHCTNRFRPCMATDWRVSIVNAASVKEGIIDILKRIDPRRSNFWKVGARFTFQHMHFGTNFILLSYSGQECDVAPYSNDYEAVNNIRIVSEANCLHMLRFRGDIYPGI